MRYDSADNYQAGANAVSPIPASCINRGRRMGTTSDILKMAGELAVVSQWGYNRSHFIADEDYCNRQ